MLLSYFGYIFVHLRQKVRFRSEFSPKFLSTLGPNPTRKARPDLQLWFKGLKLEIYKKILDKIKKFASLKIIFLLDVKCLEMLRLCSFCGLATSSIVGHIKQT